MVSSEIIRQTCKIELLLNSIVTPDTGAAMNYNSLSWGLDKNVWIKSFANDLGRLAQGGGKRMTTGTNMIFLSHRRPFQSTEE